MTGLTMAHQLFENFTPHRVREFGPWNVLNLIISALMFAMQTWAVTTDSRPFRFEDGAFFAIAVSIAAQNAEPAFPREHAAARILRIVSLLTFGIFLAGFIAITVRGGGL